LGDPGKYNSNFNSTEMEIQSGLNWGSVGFIETYIYSYSFSYRGKEFSDKPRNIGFRRRSQLHGADTHFSKDN
jgi:hypothetical protein